MDRINVLKNKALNLTTNPGVYLMKNSKGKIIYIGKAKNLKNRVITYFRSFERHDNKNKHMIENIYDFDFFTTKTEFEALILECSLIKEYQPKYNILLKDNKGYKYIKISDEPFPKITVCNKKSDDNAKYLGPYINSFSVKQAVQEVNKIFMLPTCKTNFTKHKKRPCLNFHIQRCMGVCQNKISKEKYNEIIEEAINYIKNGETSYIQKIKHEMEKAAKEENFEKAIKLRDKIKIIEKTQQKQIVYLNNNISTDIINFAIIQNEICFLILKIKNGKIYDKEDFIFKGSSEIENLKEEFLARYYYKKKYIPKNIYIGFKLNDIKLYEKYINSQTDHNVKLINCKKGVFKNLTDMAYANAKEILVLKNNTILKENKTLKELQNLLNLKNIPNYIEAYDISNLAGTELVGGMVVFKEGMPYKKNYRKFKIKTIKKQDDYSCMKEVISRRIKEFEKKTDESFKNLPDLILIDGGRTHILAVDSIFKNSNHFKAPYYGLVKDENHKTRAICSKDGEISINLHKKLFLFLTQIQDEVHRFTITYQKKLHKKNSLKFDLTSIKGVGDRIVIKLLKNYNSIDEIKQQSPEKISQTTKIELKKVKKILDFLKTN